MWLILTFISATFIGIYEVAKKQAVKDNDVWLVLFYTSLVAAAIYAPFMVLSQVGWLSPEFFLYVPTLSTYSHLLILGKTLLVLSSWVLSYSALKHLPITIAAPIRSTSPLWTILGAVLFYGERLSVQQWLGVVVTLSFFFMFSRAGKAEGVSFRTNKWVGLALLAAMFSSSSALFDKHLLRSLDKVAVQAYFTLYQLLLLAPVVWVIKKRGWSQSSFHWRWTIPLVAVLLLLADFFYFSALNQPDSLLAVVSTIRRGSVLITFALGAWLFREKNLWRKGVFLLGILGGLMILLLS